MLLKAMLLFVGSSVAVGLIAARSSAGDPPPTSANLAEWRKIIQHLDPENPGSAQYVPGLIELVRDPQLPWFTRRQAALTLGRMGTKASAAVPLLQQLLDEPTDPRGDESTRLWAAKALALFGPTASPAARRLAEIVGDAEQPIPLRITALEALGRIGADSPPVLPAFLDALSVDSLAPSDLARLQLRIAAAEGLGLLGPSAAPAIPQLIQACRDRSSLLRLPAATTLGTIGPAAEVAVPALSDLVLFDDVPEVADAAAKSLGSIGISALPALSQLLQDEEEQVRLRAVWGLMQMGSAATAELQKGLNDRSPLVAIWAAEGLLAVPAMQEHSVVVGRCMELLEDDDRQVRIKAYRVLLAHPGKLGPFVDRLRELAQSPRADVRRAALGLLEAIPQRSGSMPPKG